MKIYIVSQWIPHEGYWDESYHRDLHDALIQWQYIIGDQITCWSDYGTLAEAARDEDGLLYGRWDIREVEVL